MEDPGQDQESHRRRAGLGCSAWTAPLHADIANRMNAEALCRSWLVVQVSIRRQPVRSSEVAPRHGRKPVNHRRLLSHAPQCSALEPQPHLLALRCSSLGSRWSHAAIMALADRNGEKKRRNARRKFSIAAQDLCFERRCDESSAGGRWMALTAQYAQTRVHRCLALFRFTSEIPQQDRGRVIDIEHDTLRGVTAQLDNDRPLKSAQLNVPLKSCGRVRSAQLCASTEERGEPDRPTRCPAASRSPQALSCPFPEFSDDGDSCAVMRDR